MKAPRFSPIGIEIDELTNSIVLAISGESLQTVVAQATAADLRMVTKKSGWRFKWREEAREATRTIFKLTLANEPTQIQGLISLEDLGDHIYMHLIEAAPVNFGSTKKYIGVPGNLVAYACKMAFENGHEGNLAFVSKTQLIQHYADTLGATHVGNHVMIIYPFEARTLVNRYFGQLNN